MKQPVKSEWMCKKKKRRGADVRPLSNAATLERAINTHQGTSADVFHVMTVINETSLMGPTPPRDSFVGASRRPQWILTPLHGTTQDVQSCARLIPTVTLISLCNRVRLGQ